MSLRPSDDRDTKHRSRSRNRSRDGRASSPPKPSKSSKDKKKARFTEMEDDDEPSVPGAFEPSNNAKYEVRAPSSTAPGLSALASGLPPLSGRRDDPDGSEGDRYASKKKSSSRRHQEESPSPPASATMPSFPGMGMPSVPEHPRNPSLSSKASPYPSGGPQYPVDGGMFSMPSADYGVLNSYDYPPSAATPSHQSHDSYGSREARPHPATVGSYHEDDQPRHPPAPTRGYTFPMSAKEPEPLSREEKSRDSRKGSDSRRLSGTGRSTELRVPGASSLNPGMNRLSVSGGRPDNPGSGKGLPPPSPLLEAYTGTYGSMPPMHMRMMSATEFDDIETLSPLDEPGSRPSSKEEDKPLAKRRARIYDSEADAKAIWDALKHHHTRPEPLIKILPELTHDQMLELNTKYKNTYKKSGEKVDMAKHIKSETEGQFQKICFVTATGKWKAEAYWANFWYQSHATGRELLIESLMGRTNAEIREIKKAFRDKRYDNDLGRCLKKELKPDKFRDAILEVLEENRQEETDAWPIESRNRDVDILRRAILSREGGESAILRVVVNRSDKHLRQVLLTYETMYKSKFASDATEKSKNLVGEVIAHILNGVINRPQRDMLLLRHAIQAIASRDKTQELRYELLMSRLIRLHWDRLHLAKVKSEYKSYYKTNLEEDVEEATKGDFGEFCVRLCET